MDVPPPTVHSVLCGPPADIRNVGPAIRTALGPNWMEINTNRVSRWHDFTFANLWPAFGDILTEALSSGTLGPPPPIDSINNLTDVRDMASNVFSATLSVPIADGADILQDRTNSERIDVSTGRDLRLPSGLVPAHCFYLDGPSKRWLVLGAVRMGGDWHSSLLAQEQPEDKAFWPLQQLATYSRDGETPYAFIFTEEEVVVVRFFLVYEDGSEQFGAEWQAIPRDQVGHDVLNPNLAIWCLVMMSLDENRRQVRARDDTLPINAWWKWRDRTYAGAIYYQHHLSLRHSYTLPACGLVVEYRPHY